MPLSENALAHTMRCMAVARAAEKRGHKTAFAADRKVADLIVRNGFELFEGGFESAKSLSDPEFYVELRRYEIRAAEKFAPDYVVNDPMFSGCFINQALGIPYVFLTNATLLPCYGGAYGVGPDAKASRMDNYFGYIYPRDVIFPRLKKTAKSLGIGFPESYDELFDKADKIFIPSVSLIDPVRAEDALAAKCVHIGSLAADMEAGHSQGLDDFVRENPLFIYISFGGSVGDAGYYNAAIASVLSAGYAAVVSLGPQVQRHWIDKPLAGDSRVYIAKYLPGLAVSKKAKMVIHSGGHGTLMHCLEAEVPSITVPNNIDQFTFSETARQQGCSLTYCDASGDIARADFRTVIDERSTAALSSLIAQIDRDYAGFKRSIGNVAAELNGDKPEKSAEIIVSFLEANRKTAPYVGRN